MRRKISASLLAFMLVFQALSSGYLAPFTALASEPIVNDSAETTEIAAEPTAAELEAAKLALENATKSVNDLFTDSTHKTIKAGLVDGVINTAEAAVNVLEDEQQEKANLQALIAEARAQVATAKAAAIEEEAAKEQAAAKEEPKEENTEADAKEEAEAEKSSAKEEEPAKEEAKPAKKAAARTMVAPAVAPTSNLTEVLTETQIAATANMYANKPDEIKNGDAVIGYSPNGDKLEEAPVDLKYPFYLLYELSLKKGTYVLGTEYTYTMQLPTQFAAKNTTGNLPGLNESVATYKIVGSDTGSTVTFSMVLDQETIDDLENENANVSFFYAQSFSNTVINSQSLEEILNFKYGNVTAPITIKIKKDETQKIVKNGIGNKGNEAADSIEWTIDVNNPAASLTNVKINDTLPAGLKVPTTIYKQEYTVDRTGKFLAPVGEKTALVGNDLTNINLGTIDKPYRISYTTEVEDRFKVGNKTFDNKVELTYGTDNKSIATNKSLTFNYGEPISKRAVKVDHAKQLASWEITFNGNYRDIEAGKNTVTDTMNTVLNQRFNAITSVKSYEKGTNTEKVEATSVVDFSGSTFTFPTGNKKYVVEYTTKYDRITDEKPYYLTNTADYNGIKTPVVSHYVAQVGIQKNKEVDFSKKEIKWKITLGTDSGVIPAGTIITDTYDEELEIVNPPATILGNKVDYDDVVVYDAEGKNGKKKFSFTLSAEATSGTEFSYVTKFDPNKLPSDSNFNNVVNASNGAFSMTASSNEPINSITKLNGVKSGVYNYLTNQIDWTVDVNYNLDQLTNANITDTWTDNHFYVTNSLKVHELALAANQDSRSIVGGDLSASLNASTANGNLVIPLPDGKKAYRITYSTQLGAKQLGMDGSDVLVVATFNNTATINNGSKVQDLPATANTPVKDMQGTELLTKSGVQNGDIANWQVSINKGQSFIQAGKVLKDELSAGQYYDETSFVLKQKIYDANNKDTFTWHSVAIAEGSLKFKEEDTKFELTLPEMNKEYLLQYNTVILADHNESISNKVALYDVDRVMKDKASNFQVKWEESGGAANIPSGSGKLEFVKTAPSGKLLEGVEFNIYSVKSDGTKGLLVETVRTNEQGVASTEKKYKYKKYLVEEVTAPAGYKKNADTIYTFGKLDGGKIVIPTVINEVDLAACTDLKVKIDLTDQEVKRVVVTQGATIASSFDQATQTISIDHSAVINKTAPYFIEMLTTDNKKITVLSIDLKFESETNGSAVKCLATITDSTNKISFDACTYTTVMVMGAPISPTTPFLKGAVVVYDKAGKEVDRQVLSAPMVTFNKHYHEKGYDIYVELSGYQSIKVDLNGNCEAVVNVDLTKACAEIAVTVKADTKLVKGAKVQILDKLTGTAQELNDAKETTLTTDVNGKVIIPVKYATGDYNISIIASGYKYAPKEFSSVNCELIIDLNNVENSCPTYVIKVVGENGEDITATKYDKFRTDSVFTLTSAALNLEIKNVKIDNDGELAVVTGNTLTKIDKAMLQGAEDEYVLTQTETAAGFKTLAPMKVKDLNNCTASVTINFSNTTEPVNPGITCPDFTVNYNGPADSQAEFKLVELVTVDGKEIETVVTENIKVITDGTTKKQTLDFATSSKPITVLEDGKYKLVQTKAHPAYDKATDTTFTVVEGVCKAELTVTNELTICSVDPVITITDKSGKEIPVSQVDKVTVNGKEVTPKIENGKLVIERKDVKQEVKNEVIVTLKGGSSGTVTIPERSVECDFTVIVTNVCDKDPNITITTTDGKEIPASQVDKVTVNGKEVTPKIENGKLVIERKDVKQEEKNEVTVTLKDGNGGTITIPEFSKDCDFTIIVTNVCDKDANITITTTDGKEIPATLVEKVTVNGKVVTPKIENGKLVIERKDVKQEEKNEVTVTLKDGNGGTITIPEFSKDCDFTIIVTNVCDKDANITITTADGKKIPTTLVDKVTVNGKEVTPKIENGKLVIERKDVKQEEKNVVKVTLKDGNGGTITIPEFSKDCDFTIIVTNVCDENPNIKITTAGGKKIPTSLVEKVTINGKEVTPKIENGKLVIERKDVKQEEKNVVTVTLKDGNTGTVTIPEFSKDCNFTIVVKNACEEVVVKVTLDGKPFKNAKVTVENEGGKVVQTTKSNNEGKVVIKPEFATDDHTLFVTVFEETKSFDLDHCVINANFFTEVAVDGDDEENYTPDTNVDGDEESNDGGNGNQEVPTGEQGLLTYDVYDENGKLIERNVPVGADGKVDLSHLPPGNYVLVSQDGEKTIKMTVTKEQSKVQTEENKLPQTGTQSIWLSTMAGLMLLALGAALIGRNRKKHA